MLFQKYNIQIMKTIFLGLAVIALVFMAFRYQKVDFKVDSESGIQFHKGTFQQAMELAEKENKLIFLDIYATWCGPCKKLKSTTFSNKEVGDFYNQSFINIALDGENGEGVELARKYGVRGYPTLLFIDASGKVVGQTSGYHSPSELIGIGKKFTKNKP